MKDLGELLRENPYKNRLVFGGKADIISALLPYKKVSIAAYENDYLFYAADLKDFLVKCGKGVEIFSLDEGGFVSGLFCESEAVVAVGGRAILDVVRKEAAGAFILFVPTSFEFYFAFSPCIAQIQDGLPCAKNYPLPDKVVFDTSVLPRLKTRHVADGLCIAACTALWQLESQNYELTKLYEDFLAIKECLKAVADNPYRSLLACQIHMGRIVFHAPQTDFSSDFATAFLLSGERKCATPEARFYCSKIIAAFYEKVFSKKVIANDITPDYNGLYLALSAMSGAPSNAVYERAKPIPPAECAARLKTLYDQDFHGSSIDCKEFLAFCQKVYSAIYKGRKKRFEVSPRSAVTAMALSSLLTSSPLKVLTDHGVTQILTEIK